MHPVPDYKSNLYICRGVRSYKNLASGWDQGVWHVSIYLWHREWDTPGSPRRYAGIFGGLLSKHHRYRAFPLFEAGSGIKLKVESKTGKSRMIRKSNCLTKKKFHIPCATLNSYLGWLMRCKVALTTNLFTETTLPWKFHLSHAIPDQASLLCANFVPTSISPTLYGLL